MSPKSAAWLAGLSTYGVLFAAACLVRPVQEVFDGAVALTLLSIMVCLGLCLVALLVLGAIGALLTAALWLVKALDAIGALAVWLVKRSSRHVHSDAL